MSFVHVDITYRDKDGAIIPDPHPEILTAEAVEIRILTDKIILIKEDGSKITFVGRMPFSVAIDFIR